jgi:uncharacterized C2H2 Zn-finger protein
MNYQADKYKFSCPVADCDRMFVSDRDVQQHVNGKHTSKEERPFGCHLCSSKFTREWSLNRHLHTVHGNDEPSGVKRKRGETVQDTASKATGSSSVTYEQRLAPSAPTRDHLSSSHVGNPFDINRYPSKRPNEDIRRATKRPRQLDKTAVFDGHRASPATTRRPWYDKTSGTIDPALLAADALFAPATGTSAATGSSNGIANQTSRPGGQAIGSQYLPVEHGDALPSVQDVDFDLFVESSLKGYPKHG